MARRLVETGYDPEDVRMEAFGEHRPIAENDTPEGRARNRRVEFFYARHDIITAVARWRADILEITGQADTTEASSIGEAATADADSVGP